MKELRRKLFRDLTAQKWLFMAVSVVILLGVAMFAAPTIAYENLKSSYDYTYQQLHFADIWIKVAQAPTGTVQELSSIPGVTKATERVNTSIPLMLPSGKSLIARVISLPDSGRAAINDVKVTDGTYFSDTGANQLLVAKNFADYHHLKPGDKLTLQINGTDTVFTMEGAVVSPEYIFPAKSQQEMFVSADEFGVIFIKQNVLQRLTGSNTVNEFCLLTATGKDINSIINRAENVLAQYNVVGVTTRATQPSNAGLKMDLDGFGQLAEIFPLLFLVVGILTTYILLTRLVQRQRNQIGIMRALGYSRSRIISHYLGFAVLIGIAGAILGAIAGYFMGQGITVLYVGDLHLPYTALGIHWPVMLEGFFIGFIPCIAAGIIPSYTAGRLSPAEAMHSLPPSAGRKLLLERIFPFLSRISMVWKIPLRNIFRNRRRSLSIIIGVIFGTALVLVSLGFIDSINGMLDFQFNKIQRYDAKISFADLQPQSISNDVAGWPQTTAAEPFIQIPVRLEHNSKTTSTLLYGLAPDTRLLGLYDTGDRQTEVTGNGVLLGTALQQQLGLKVGDSITLVTPGGNLNTKVAGFVKQPLGSMAYISLEQAQQMLGGQAVINGIFLKTNASASEIRDRAAKTLGPVSLEITHDFKAKIVEMMGLFNVIAYVMLLFGVIMALMVVFTVVTVGLVERSREIATMRTLGEKGSRITTMVTLENLVLGIIGLAFGIPLGYLVSRLLLNLINSDMFSVDLVIDIHSYIITAGLIIVVVFLSQIPGVRNINRLNLAKVTKEQVI